MSTTPQNFEDLAQVVEHELFPDVDLALRRGRHIDREDAAWYGFLTDAQAHLERLYRRFGAELVQRTDGFFFLLPSGDKLGRRHLSPSEMLVGQGLTLLYLEPATLEQGGVTTRDQLLSQLSASMGTEQLMLAFNAKKKRMDERVAQELVRTRVSEAIRRLAGLGFVELLPEERIRLRASLMRFAEPVRGSGAELEALNRLVASGEVALTDDDDGGSGSDDFDDSPTPREPGQRKRPEAAHLPEWNEGSEWGASFDAPPASTDDEADGTHDLAPAADEIDTDEPEDAPAADDDETDAPSSDLDAPNSDDDTAETDDDTAADADETDEPAAGDTDDDATATANEGTRAAPDDATVNLEAAPVSNEDAAPLGLGAASAETQASSEAVEAGPSPEPARADEEQPT